MGRETPIKANNVAAPIGATLELNKHNYVKLYKSLTSVTTDM